MSNKVTGATQVVAVIGDPIDHSLSPVIHNAAFAALDLDWVCVALPTSQGAASPAVEGMRALGIRGMSVTMPHKAAVLGTLDKLTADAESLGSVNCIVRSGTTLVGHSTDGAGFVAGLREDFDFDPEGSVCVVLGAGGAARAVVLALARAGAESVVVVNRSSEGATRAAELAGSVGRVGRDDDVVGADVIVNATPVGMAGFGSAGTTPSIPIDVSTLRPGQIIADLVYSPLETELMRQAQARGARVANGVSMLVHQAAIAFESWTGREAPLGAMLEAARSSLG